MPRQRRPKGEGSVFESPRGSGRWWARLPRGTDGTQPKRRADSEADGFKVLRQLERERAQGRTNKTRPLFCDYAAAWLEEHQQHVKATTHESYTARIRRAFIPTFGKQRLDVVTRPMVQRWINEYARTHAADTSRNDLKLLDSMLAQAVTARLLAFNPCDGVRLPKTSADAPARKAVALTFAQVDALLRAAEGTPSGVLLFLAITTGMREGELLGLRWPRVQFDGGPPRIRVVEQLQSVNGQLIFTTPKSKKSTRDIPLDADVVRVLRAHRATQYAARLRAGAAWQDHVWCSLVPTARCVTRQRCAPNSPRLSNVRDSHECAFTIYATRQAA